MSGAQCMAGGLLGSGQIPLHSLELGSERGTQVPSAARTGQGLQDISGLPHGLCPPTAPHFHGWVQ